MIKKAFITKSNLNSIVTSLEEIEQLNSADKTALYKYPIYFLHKNEIDRLLKQREFLKDPENVFKIYKKKKSVDSKKYIFEGAKPAYHTRKDCINLNSNFNNYEIPTEIQEKGDAEIEKFRKWFKSNQIYLSEKPDLFSLKLQIAFGLSIVPVVINHDNSGLTELDNLNLNDLEERIDSIASHLIDVNIFENIYKPIQIVYNDRKTFLYIAKINDELYINVNSISEKSYPMDRWKRGSEIKNKILEYNFKLKDKQMLSIYSHKNKGTWILFDFFCKNYFNWYGSIYNKVNNNSCYLNFGTFLEIQLPKLIDEYDISTDKYFIQIKREAPGEGFFKVRANRENNFINVTDLFNAHDRDVRTFNKNSERKKYFSENPEDHYLNGNNITDEFGMKVTFCHPKLAIVIVDWLYKKNESEEKQQILDFINYFMDKV